MPSYTLKDQNDQTQEVIMSWSELEKHLQENPQLKVVPSAPKIVSSAGTNLGKSSDGWKDLVKNMKKKAGRESTIKT